MTDSFKVLITENIFSQSYFSYSLEFHVQILNIDSEQFNDSFWGSYLAVCFQT